jgi:hypothetical protein
MQEFADVSEQIDQSLCDVCGAEVMFESGTDVSNCRHQIRLRDAAPSEPSDEKVSSEHRCPILAPMVIGMLIGFMLAVLVVRGYR